VPTRPYAKSDDIGDFGDRKFLFGRKSLPLKEGFEESIGFNAVGMFESHRI